MTSPLVIAREGGRSSILLRFGDHWMPGLRGA
jgi:hypothetical protein